jgi:hypothetical protein
LRSGSLWMLKSQNSKPKSFLWIQSHTDCAQSIVNFLKSLLLIFLIYFIPLGFKFDSKVMSTNYFHGGRFQVHILTSLVTIFGPNHPHVRVVSSSICSCVINDSTYMLSSTIEKNKFKVILVPIWVPLKPVNYRYTHSHKRACMHANKYTHIMHSWVIPYMYCPILIVSPMGNAGWYAVLPSVSAIPVHVVIIWYRCAGFKPCLHGNRVCAFQM